MLTIPQHLLKIAEAIWVRIVIFTLSFLALEFGRMFITVGVKTHPHMTLWSGVLYEATIVIVFGLLFGMRHVGRDINMLNCCAVLFYLVYMLFYYCGINVSEYHNWFATCINVLIVVRLCYFGSRDVFVSISHVLHFEKWLLDRRWFFNPYINGLTITLCIFCAIPLCALIYQINTDRMRITGIAIILFAFYAAIEVANKRRLAQAVAHGDDSLGGRVGLVVSTSQNAIAAYLLTQFTRLKLTIHRVTWPEVLLWWMVVIAMLLGWFIFQHEQKMMFKFGYVSGYADGESGQKKKIDEQWLLLMRCYRGHDDFRGFPPPPPRGTKSPCDD